MSINVVRNAWDEYGVRKGAEEAFKAKTGGELASDIVFGADKLGIQLTSFHGVSEAARDAIGIREPEVAAAAAPVRPAPGSRPTPVPGGPAPV
jgi:hypothetical protein